MAYEETREDRIHIAMSLYRNSEEQAFRETRAETKLRDIVKADLPRYGEILEAWRNVEAGIHDHLRKISVLVKKKEAPPFWAGRAPTDYDLSHFAGVARECFMLKITRDEATPGDAATFALERIGATMTDEEFLVRENLLEPADEAPAP